ncbi:ABC transporter transmembrane domain-containing protein [Luteococcus sp.]|uniref:ABC transporter transmembrane domain-containing protein n=1 Tax=Luteococcus sp. TaxID=1969402 RepID=UPI0037360A8F
MSDSTRLPRLWRGSRRPLLAGLAAMGFGQAAVAGATALLTPRMMGAATTRDEMVLATLLSGLALLLGVLRAGERVLGERLGQDYVHEVRMHLVRAALVGRGPSVGVTVARATNDLTSVRNWMVQGIVPLLSGIPTVVGCLAALAMLSWKLSVAVAIPLAALALLLVVAGSHLRRRAARLRRQRGRLAGQIADAVQASEPILVAGGVEREVKSLGRQSRELGDRAVSRATLSGVLRGAAASVATLAMVFVGATAVLTNLDAATIATAFLIVGMLATPVTDLGRVGEFRQSFRVAQQILGPQLQLSREHRADERRARRQSAEGTTIRPLEGRGRAPGRGLHCADLEVEGRAVPELVVAPGEVVVPVSRDPQRLREVVRALCHPQDQPEAWIQVDGCQLGQLPAQERRQLLGVAAAGQLVERGTIARAVRYRSPDSDRPVGPVLASVGLDGVVKDLERTVLRRGGEPLDDEQRSRLALARAIYDDPALLVLDNIDRGLSAEGRQRLSRLLPRPGVTILVSDHPERLVADHRVWDLDADPARPQLAIGAGRRAGTA